MAHGLIPWDTRSNALLDNFRREMDELFDRFGALESGTGERAPFFAPHTNLAETDSHYEIAIDLPGMKPEDFEIEMKEGRLWITGERRQEQEEKEKTYHRVERQYGQFRRIISLGSDVDADRIEAEYKDGVLTVQVPKAEEARPKKIQVK